MALTLALALQKTYFGITNFVLKNNTFMFFLLLSYLASVSLCYKYLKWTLALTNMAFNEFLEISNKSLGSFIFDYGNSHTNLVLKSNTTNEFLIISNKNIGFFVKFYHGFSERYRIFERQNLFAIFESLKFVKFLMHTISKFKFKTFPFKCLVVSNYIAFTSYMVATLQLHIVKNG